MERTELIQNTQQFITSGNGIPTKLNEKEINRVIDDALRWFYKEYDDALETKYFVVPQSAFETQEFKDTRKIKLPDCVVWVTECKEAYNISRFQYGDRDVPISRMIAADIYLGSYASDDLTNRIAFASYYDLAKAFLKDWTKYDYNPNTNELVLEGGTPRDNLALTTYVKVEESSLFDDYLFIDYVRGASLESLGRMMGFYTMNLAGGVTVNANAIETRGKEMMTEVKEKIKELQPHNFVAFW